ncbi:hypothetical protein [Planktotalea arctica]|uniref:hypothetical protein n=1 Tax=Planktotalea arctica TaxID=1481893 RepID=UPI00321A6D0D
MLSFSLPTKTATNSFTLAGMSGLSMGTDARDMDAGDPRRGTFATGGILTGSTNATATKSTPAKSPVLSFGNFFPTTGNTGASWVGTTPLSMPASVPKSSSSNRFTIGGTLSALTQGLSFGTPVSSVPQSAVSAYSAPRPSTLAALPTSVVPVQRTGDDFAISDLMAEASNAFADMFQNASAQASNFGGGSSTGGGASFKSVTSTDALIAGGAGLVLIALLWPRKRSAPASTSRARSVPKRRKTTRAKR